MMQSTASLLPVPGSGGNGPGMTPPPKKPLEEAIERIGRTIAAGERLATLIDSADAAGILPVRLLFLAAEWPGAIPAGDTPAEFVRNCIAHGWQAIPATLPGMKPRTGDLFVVTGDNRREIEDVGLVGAVDTEGTFFYGVSGALQGPLAPVPEWRRRREPSEVDFFLRVPG